MLLATQFKRFIRFGHLEMIAANGKSYHFGDKSNNPSCTIRLHKSILHRRLLLNPDLYLGEAFMNGDLTIEQGTLYDLLYLFGLNLQNSSTSFWQSLMEKGQQLWQKFFGYIPFHQAKANVAHHYDLSGVLYEKFLDQDMQYSCAYFTHPDNSLEQAQLDKKKHITAKLLLEPGMKVLDIGCGWGGLALYMAKTKGVQVTGLTLSEEQHKVACQRAKEEGLQNLVQFHLRDYRQEKQSYDRVVSVGMFEHVGTRHYQDFFRQLRSLLNPMGVALLHSIGRMDGPGQTNPWLKKYIFPGGYAPALSEVVPVIEQVGLWITDIEILRLHYAYTLQNWRQRFLNNRPHITKLYNERFCRMWDFYLCAAEIDFRLLSTMVFQIQITRDIQAVPITRDYMLDQERQLTSAVVL